MNALNASEELRCVFKDGSTRKKITATLTDEHAVLLFKALARPLGYTTLRCNSLNIAVDEALQQVKEKLAERYETRFNADIHPVVRDLIVISNKGPVYHEKMGKEAIVDAFCASAVLRGADIFAQRIIAMSTDVQKGDMVSVFLDLDGCCLKGSKPSFSFPKIYLGNGIAKVNRQELYTKDGLNKRGVGIEMAEPLMECPSLDNFLPRVVFAQNLPSALCAHVLDPQPGETILDMCAAPGGKTAHIGLLMKNSGTLIGLDKAKPKIETLRATLEKAGVTIASVYCYDACQACSEGHAAVESAPRTLLGSPPYATSSFDRILLDAPCSALGQRPSFSHRMSSRELSSYASLQHSLIQTAVRLLRPGGTLVYSTCTFVPEENEKQVARLLAEHPDMQLVPQGIYQLAPSILYDPTDGQLTPDDLSKLQRFHPAFLSCSDSNSDTIGFFIAKLVKQTL